MSEQSDTDDIDLAYELIVLRGPDAPREGEVKGGVVGGLVARQRLTDKALIAILVAICGGLGGTFAWVYAAGQRRGEEQAETRQRDKKVRELRRDVDKLLGKKSHDDDDRDTPDSP